MKKICLFLRFFVLLFTTLFPTCQTLPDFPTNPGPVDKDPDRERQVVLRFKESTKPQDRADILSQLDDNFFIRKACLCDWQIVLLEAKPHIDPDERLAEADSDVEQNGNLSENQLITLDQNDPPFPFEIHTQFARMANPKPLTIAIVDGGINVNLPSFNSRMWINDGEYGNPNFDGDDDDGNCLVDDVYGFDFYNYQPLGQAPLHPHGTQVASVITNNFGGAFNLKLMDLKIFSENGRATLFEAICAIHYAAQFDIHAINLSWSYQSNEVDSTLYYAIEEARQKDIVVVAAAGNDTTNTDTNPYYPAALTQDFDNLVSVAALNTTLDDLAIFSNFGPLTITLAAPGEGISVIDPGGGPPITVEGTSFAAPFVAGLTGIINWKNNTAIPMSTMLDCMKTKVVGIGAPLVTHGKIDGANVGNIVSNCP